MVHDQVLKSAAAILDLNDLDEQCYVFYGDWETTRVRLADITKADALRYMKKALDARNVFVEMELRD